MTCSNISGDHEGSLLAYGAGELGVEAASDVELHMQSCAECASVVADQAKVWKALDSWQPQPVSAAFDQKLFERIELEQSASWWKRASVTISEFFRPVLMRPAFPLSVAALIVAAGFVMDHPRQGLSTPNTAAFHVSSSDIDKVEATLEDMEMLRQFDATTDEKEPTVKSM